MKNSNLPLVVSLEGVELCLADDRQAQLADGVYFCYAIASTPKIDGDSTPWRGTEAGGLKTKTDYWKMVIAR